MAQGGMRPRSLIGRVVAGRGGAVGSRRGGWIGCGAGTRPAPLRLPRRCGYQATSWTVPLLAHYLAVREGIAVSARTLRRRLHEAGYRWKRPRHVYAGRATHLAQKRGLWSGA
jgi:hypothetical protein